MADTKQSDPKQSDTEKKPKAEAMPTAKPESKHDTEEKKMIESVHIPKSSQRVSEHTRPQVNAQLQRQLEANVAYYARHPEQIDARLKELDREWDIERALEANAGSLALMGLGLGLLNRRWRLVSVAVTGFLAHHAIKGWCPPLPILRRMGVRTMREIDQERFALKALRGDFSSLGPDSKEDPATRAMKALAAAASE